MPRHGICVNGPVLRETGVASFMGALIPMQTDTSGDLRAPEVKTHHSTPKVSMYAFYRLARDGA